VCEDDSNDEECHPERGLPLERISVVVGEGEEGKSAAEPAPTERLGGDGRRSAAGFKDYRPPGQISDEEESGEERAPGEEPSRRSPPREIRGEAILCQHGSRGESEDDPGQVERVGGRETRSVESGEAKEARAFEEAIEAKERKAKREEAQGVGAKFLGVSDVERGEGEEERRHEGGSSARAACYEISENGDRAEAPENGRQLPCPVGGRQKLGHTGDQVVERRVNGVELERFPEERPVPLDPVSLEDLVQAIGEMVEPAETDGAGENENRRE
jgi:hypothetical protein